MKIFTKALLLMLSVTILTSCSVLQPVNTNALKIGMSKEEAQIALKRKPDSIVAAKNFPEAKTIVEVVQYKQSDINGFWLYFTNNKLSKWEPISTRHQPYIDDLVPIF